MINGVVADNSRVILARGLSDKRQGAAILGALGDYGFKVVELREIPPANEIATDGVDAVLAYVSGGLEEALAILSQVDSSYRSAPLFVLVDEPKLGDYCCLTGRGVRGYYPLDDRPQALARAVAHAAAQRRAA